MKVSEVLIAWTPVKHNGTAADTAGKVAVGPLLQPHDVDWARPFQKTGGAAYAEVQKLHGTPAIAEVFKMFHKLVVQEKIPVNIVHSAFLQIDE